MTQSPCTSTRKRFDLSTDIPTRFLVIVPVAVSHHRESVDCLWKPAVNTRSGMVQPSIPRGYMCSPKSPEASCLLFRKVLRASAMFPVFDFVEVFHYVLVEGFHLALNLYSTAPLVYSQNHHELRTPKRLRDNFVKASFGAVPPRIVAKFNTSWRSASQAIALDELSSWAGRP
jgi:hypothetical protein